jgi:hypothetical protein
MIAGVHLGLNLDDLAVARDAVGIHFDERVTLAKKLDERIDLLGLERTVKGDFSFGLGSFDQSFLPLIGGQFVEAGEDLPGAFSRAGRVRLSDGARKYNHGENHAKSFHA